MQSSSIPNKFLVPFAQNDAAKVEIPVTTADTTRASQSLGFPPRTMLPPEASGVPPQGEDFNGAMNQIARAAWWMLQGNGFPFDSTFAINANIGGYAKGASIPRADLTGFWLNGADDNATNPEATDGTAANWLPGYNYGTYTVAGFASANITLYPVQAARDTLILTGALTASVQLIVPAWLKTWTVVNNVTLGAFTITIKTASGTGVVLASGAQRVRGDGTNITQVAESIAPATTATQALQMGQVSGVVGQSRNAKLPIATASTSGTFTADEIILESALGGLRYCLANVSDTFNLTTDMDTGSAPISGYVALYKLYNPATGASIRRIVNATSTIAPEVYAGATPPAGYTASALVSVRPTDATGKFVPGLQRDRRVSLSQVQVLNTSTPQAAPTAVSIAGAVPRNAKTASGSYAITNSADNGGASVYIAGDSAWAGQAYASITTPIGGNGVAAALPGLDMDVPQTLYYTLSGTGGTATLIIWISGYIF